MSPLLITTIVGAIALSGSAWFVVNRIAGAGRWQDGAERLLALTTAGLNARRAEWGAAMRAELAAIEEPDERRRFSQSASAAALRYGLGSHVAFGLGTGPVVAAAVLTASRMQLEHGGPGVLPVTVFTPTVALLVVALMSARRARSFLAGVATGAFALGASFCAVFAVVALEGLVWMERHGVFVLDGDVPPHAVRTFDIVFDFFTTGMWLGHLIIWLPWLLTGAALGSWIASRRQCRPSRNGA